MDHLKIDFKPQVPKLDLSDGSEMLTDFSREAQRHLISARNSLLVLETVHSDKEALENIFKTFHTISGLSEFLDLQDICVLSKHAETLINFVRKGERYFEDPIAGLITGSVKGIQHLLELLDEQIEHAGVLSSDYFDVSELLQQIRRICDHQQPEASTVAEAKPIERSVQPLVIDPGTPTYMIIKQKFDESGGKGSFFLETATVSHLMNEFEMLEGKLKDAQSKIQQRQHELIRERELALKLTKKAQDEARTKSEYLANMSHEIRTLINAILGFTDLIKGNLPEGSKQRGHLNTIILSGKMLLEIVNNILDFSKVEAGKLKLESIPFNLKTVTQEVLQIIRTRLDRKPINLFLEIDPNVPLDLIGDPTRLKQVFINLLDNAIKFTDKGEIGISIRYEQRKNDVYTLRFLVSDTGIGIPDDRKDQVFETFTQADISTTRLYGGTGLGLALCRAFVVAMGGKIWIETQLGKGSNFYFEISFKTSSERLQAEPVTDLAGLRIAVVSSGETTIRVAQRLCVETNMQLVAICQNPKQATEYLNVSSSLPDIALIDMLPSTESGYELAKKLRSQTATRNMKLVAISSDVKLADDEKFRSAGFDGLLATPLFLDEFASVLRNATGRQFEEVAEGAEPEFDDRFFKGLRILVVEDSLPNQELLRVHFDTLGCICDYASNGQEALDLLKQKTFQICFMDLQMPVLGGLEAAQVMRQDLKLDIPIIALTAAEVQEEREKCVAVGMSDYLPKPFDVDQLKEKIYKFLK